MRFSLKHLSAYITGAIIGLILVSMAGCGLGIEQIDEASQYYEVNNNE